MTETWCRERHVTMTTEDVVRMEAVFRERWPNMRIISASYEGDDPPRGVRGLTEPPAEIPWLETGADSRERVCYWLVPDDWTPQWMPFRAWGDQPSFLIRNPPLIHLYYSGNSVEDSFFHASFSACAPKHEIEAQKLIMQMMRVPMRGARCPMVRYRAPLAEPDHIIKAGTVTPAARRLILADPTAYVWPWARPVHDDGCFPPVLQQRIRGPELGPAGQAVWTEPVHPAPNQGFEVRWQGCVAMDHCWIGVVPRGTPDLDRSVGHWHRIDAAPWPPSDGSHRFPGLAEAGVYEVRAIGRARAHQAEALLALTPFRVVDPTPIAEIPPPLLPPGQEEDFWLNPVEIYRRDQGAPPLARGNNRKIGGMFSKSGGLLLLAEADLTRLEDRLRACWSDLVISPMTLDMLACPLWDPEAPWPPPDPERLDTAAGGPDSVIVWREPPGWAPLWERQGPAGEPERPRVFLLNYPQEMIWLTQRATSEPIPGHQWLLYRNHAPYPGAIAFEAGVLEILDELFHNPSLVKYGGLFSETGSRWTRPREIHVGPVALSWCLASPERALKGDIRPLAADGRVPDALPVSVLTRPVTGWRGLTARVTPFRPAPGAALTIAWAQCRAAGPFRVGVVPTEAEDDDTDTGIWWNVDPDSPDHGAGEREVVAGLAAGTWEVRVVGRRAPELAPELLLVHPFKVAPIRVKAYRSTRRSLPDNSSLWRNGPALIAHYRRAQGRAPLAWDDDNDDS